jgi:hypothetical protein
VFHCPQAAAKAAAAAEAASAARAAQEEACSTYTDEDAIADDAIAHTSEEPRCLRRKSAEQLPHVALRTRSTGTLGAAAMDAADAVRKRGGEPPFTYSFLFAGFAGLDLLALPCMCALLVIPARQF